MATTMRAAVVERPGAMAYRSMPLPDIGDDEVLIQVKYTGICGTDWSIFTGKYSADRLPLIAGHEFSGVVAAVGKRARGLAAGDRVTADINMSCGTCFYCRKGQKLMCPEFTQLGIHTHGTYAEYVKAPWQQLHKLPDNLSFLEGAFIEPLSCVIHSAKAMQVELGASVAVIGCGLGVLHAALARYRGAAPVIVLGDNTKRLEVARRLGADYALDVRQLDDPVEEVRKLTGGRGADYVIEAVGTPATYEQALSMMRPGGTLAAFGITGVDDVVRMRPFDLVLGEKRITGSCAGVGNDWTDAITLLAHQRLDVKALFSMIVPLEELRDALERLRSDPNLIKVFVSPEITSREMLA
ncbi:MAG: zinc-dependent alcohol dehydrogenase [Planctomycetota bacterium]